MSPEDRKRFARSIILKVIKDNPEGISIPQVSDITGIDRRTVSKHLDYLTAIRELYKRQFSQRNRLYYPNGKVAHPTLIKDIKIGDKYYNFQIIENRGVLLDKAGNKYLDMTVQISSPCPFCGEKHIFHANELACPFPDD